MQVILGTIKLDSSSQNFPLRFYLTESLLRLSKETGVHVQLAPTLLEPLESPLMRTAHPKKKPEKEIKPVDFDVTLRVPSSYLAGPAARIYRDQVALKVESSLVQYFDLYALNPAFPEAVTLYIGVIKEWVGKNGENCGSKFRRALIELAGKLEEHAKWVEEKRNDGMEFSTENLQTNQAITPGEGAPLREWIKNRSS
jgi:nucleolar complex protein 2